MKIKFLIVLLGLMAVQSSTAQIKMRDVFRQMPDTLLPYLTANNRLDFIDFIDSDMKASVKNSLDGSSEMTRLTDNYLSLRLSEGSSVDMRLLDVTESSDSVKQVICVVNTYGTDVRESTIMFYTTGWQLLPVERFINISTDGIVMTLGQDEPTLALIHEYRLDAPTNEDQKEFPKSSIILKWNGLMFNKY